jgi:hypothetical protein
MSDKPINPLRQRMIDDMTARRYSEKVQKAYVRHVRTFAAFLGQIAMPARLRPEHAEAVLGVVEGDALDEAGEHFLG